MAMWFSTTYPYPRYLKILGAGGIPWHHCPGNHDIDKGAASDQASRDTWRRTFGPRHYAFQYAEATFIILDNVTIMGTTRAIRTAAAITG